MSARSIVLPLILLGMPVYGAEWGQFRGPNGDSLVGAITLPTKWSEDSNVAWKVKIPGHGWSSPVVAGDKVFLTTAVSENEETPRRGERGIIPDARDPRSDQYQMKVYCISAETGEILWEDVAYEGKPTTQKHRSNTFASETPVTDGERVVFYFGMKGVNCYDLAGKRLWNKSLGEFRTQANWGTGSSPVIYADTIIIQCDNSQSSFLVGLDKTTGDELWRVNRDEKTNWSTPYLWKNKLRTELVVNGGKKLCSYDPETRQVLWQMPTSGRTSVTPIGNDETLYVDSVDNLHGSPGVLAAIRLGANGEIPMTEEGKSSSEFVLWSVLLRSYRNASPVLSGGNLYMLEQSQGIVRCFDAQTGKMRYQERVPGATGFTASPLANDGKVFLLDELGQTTVVEAASPKLKILGSCKLSDDLFWASAAVHDDRLLLRGMNHLYCIRQ